MNEIEADEKKIIENSKEINELKEKISFTKWSRNYILDLEDIDKN